MLIAAKNLFDNNSCAQPNQRLNARLNLAFAHLQARRWAAASQELEEAKVLQAQATLDQLLWSLDLEARLAIAERRPEDALHLYDKLDQRAASALSLEGQFRAALGRARALLALGRRTQEALAALDAADRFVEKQLRQVPMQAGRDTFLRGRRQEATRLYLELLLKDGQQKRAFDLVRRTYSRLLRQLVVGDRLARLTPVEQREWDQAMSSYHEARAAIDNAAAQEWSLPADQEKSAREALDSQLSRALQSLDHALAGLGSLGEEGPLSPPSPGEVVLTYYRQKGSTWVGFAAHEKEVEVSSFELADPEHADPAALARKLLGPFDASIQGAKRVRVLPYGALRGVDFHALPFHDEPLLTHCQVVYSLDLPTRAAPAPPDRPVALLVADPTGNLPEARQESAEIAVAVRGWGPGWKLQPLSGQEAKAEAVQAALPGAELFHYAGHATFAGFGGWDSALDLADRSRLTTGDILALRRAPAWVVLSSCVAGRSSQQAPGEGIGLANAFLVAGARGVIAAPRPVDDRTARELLGELYRDWQPGKDLAGQLRRAQLAYREHHPKSDDWASFRLLEP
jgi:hypothetical protein